MLIEYPDADERRRMLAQLKGIERRVWVQVEGCERVFAIADEDLERENDEKTSSVHFLRFELGAAMRERAAPRRAASRWASTIRSTARARSSPPRCAPRWPPTSH